MLSPARQRQLEGLHRRAARTILELPTDSPVAATLAEAGEWPLTLQMLHRALGHVDRLHRAPDEAALLGRLHCQLRSHMGSLCLLYEEVIEDRPVPVAIPPPHEPPPPQRSTCPCRATPSTGPPVQPFNS